MHTAPPHTHTHTHVYQVRAKEWKQTFSHYWTQLCAILGGMYVVAGQAHRLSSVVYHRYRYFFFFCFLFLLFIFFLFRQAVARCQRPLQVLFFLILFFLERRIFFASFCCFSLFSPHQILYSSSLFAFSPFHFFVV